MIEMRNIRQGGTYEPPKMKPMNGAQWQQLPLFTTKPSDEHRFPRGFTPERLRRANNLFPPVSVAEPSSSSGFYTKSRAELTPHFASEAAPGTQEVEDAIQRNANRVARRRMVDTVARSSIDTNDLSGIRQVTVAPPGRPGGPSRGAVGAYHSGTQRIGVSNLNHPMQENTLIHEIGHHADKVADPASFERRGNQRGPSPSLEGFAVGYAHAHTSERGRAPERLAYDQFHDKKAFRTEFERATGGQTVDEAKAQIDAAQPKAQHGSPPWNPRAPQQLRLFGRNADSFNTETERDFGQWGFFDPNSDQPRDIDTFRMGGGAPADPHDRLQAGVTPKNYDVGLSIKESLHNTDSAIAHAYGEGQPNLRPLKHARWPK